MKKDKQRILGRKCNGSRQYKPIQNEELLFDGEIYILMRSRRGWARNHQTDTHYQIMDNIEHRIE